MERCGGGGRTAAAPLAVPDRSQRPRVRLARGLSPATPRARAPAAPCPARDRRRHLLHRAEWVRLAPAAARVSALANDLSLLPSAAAGRHLGVHPHRAARA